jgi:hypothetical protein
MISAWADRRSLGPAFLRLASHRRRGFRHRSPPPEGSLPPPTPLRLKSVGSGVPAAVGARYLPGIAPRPSPSCEQAVTLPRPSREICCRSPKAEDKPYHRPLPSINPQPRPVHVLAVEDAMRSQPGHPHARGGLSQNPGPSGTPGPPTRCRKWRGGVIVTFRPDRVSLLGPARARSVIPVTPIPDTVWHATDSARSRLPSRARIALTLGGPRACCRRLEAAASLATWTAFRRTSALADHLW